jgi:hypothetical protein
VKVGNDFVTALMDGFIAEVGQNLSEKISARTELGVDELTKWTAKGVTLEADSFCLLVAGLPVISVDKSGLVQISGQSININGQTIALKGAPLQKIGPSAPSPRQVQGPRLVGRITHSYPVRLIAKDQDGNPLAGLRWRARLPDGSRTSGATDEKGQAKISSSTPGEVTVVFPDLKSRIQTLVGTITTKQPSTAGPDFTTEEGAAGHLVGTITTTSGLVRR